MSDFRGDCNPALTADRSVDFSATPRLIKFKITGKIGSAATQAASIHPTSTGVPLQTKSSGVEVKGRNAKGLRKRGLNANSVGMGDVDTCERVQFYIFLKEVFKQKYNH